MLELSCIDVRLGGRTLLQDLSLSLQPGRLHVIIGPNGTGKTTILKTVFGEIKAGAGSMRLDGMGFHEQSGQSWRRRIGYMPQDSVVSLDLSALEVVLLGRLDSLGLRVDDDTMLAALRALRSVGMESVADRPIHVLSGGQRQMVLFAQVLLREPRLMMLDEPVSALDLQHQITLMDYLWQQTRERDWISLVVLHDLNLAAEYADEVIVVADGRLQAVGPPGEVLTQARLESLYRVPICVSQDASGTPHIRIARTGRSSFSN